MGYTYSYKPTCMHMCQPIMKNTHIHGWTPDAEPFYPVFVFPPCRSMMSTAATSLTVRLTCHWVVMTMTMNWRRCCMLTATATTTAGAAAKGDTDDSSLWVQKRRTPSARGDCRLGPVVAAAGWLLCYVCLRCSCGMVCAVQRGMLLWGLVAGTPPLA